MFVTCSLRQDRRVDLIVCVSECQEKHSCDRFAKVSREDLLQAMKKLGIPASRLKEIEPVIEVEAKVEETEPEVEETKALAIREIPTDPESKRAIDLYDQALRLKQDIQATFLRLGAIINEIYDGKLYTMIGYQSFKQFCSEALDIKWRMALYFRAIHLKKEQLKLSEEVVAEVGMGKMIQILPVMKDKKTAERWINEAKKPGVTTERLNARVRHARGKITKEEAEKVPHTMVFKIYEEQEDNIERALELAGKITNSDARGYQLEMMATEFRSTYEEADNGFPKNTIVKNIIERIEAVLNVKVEGSVVDKTTGEMLWG